MKKVTALFLCVILAACAFPVSAFAGVEYDITINGETFTSDNLVISCGTGTATYDPEEKTLTLNKATIVSTNTDSVIKADSDLKIVLEDSNIISMLTDAAGIASGGNLEISGDGSLDIIDVGENIIGIAAKNITINGGNITLTGGMIGVGADKTLTFEGGEINASGILAAFYSNKKIIVNGGTISTSGDQYGLYTNGNMTVDGGEINAKDCPVGIMTLGDLAIDGGKINTNGTSAGIYANSNLAVGGGDITASGKTAIYAAEDMTVKGGKITATGINNNLGAGILAYHNMNVEGGEIITAGDGYGIYGEKVSVSGGKVTATGNKNGIHVADNSNTEGAAAKIYLSGGSIIAEATGTDDPDALEAQAMNVVPDISGIVRYRWRTEKTADYSEDAIPDDLVIGKYFEIIIDRIVFASSVVHQIAPVENSAALGAENPAASGEENPNTGADLASILFAGAALALAGAAMLKSKKH